MASKNPDLHQSKEKIDHSKRKLSQVGGLVVPVVLTLANRPAWGMNKCTPSGFDSAQAGIASATTFAGDTHWLTPAQWATTNATTSPAWPSGYGKLHLSDPISPVKYSEVDINYWPGTSAKMKTAVNSALGTKKWLFSSLVSSYSNPDLTIYDALSTPWAKYIVASFFNGTIAALPYDIHEAISAGPNSSWWNDFFDSFYNNCV
jgi:hypothetical protein